jgi:hypothetical protein
MGMTETDTPTPEGLGDADAMGALFDKLTAEGVEPEGEAVEAEAPQEDTTAAEPEKAPEPEPEAKPEPVAAPTELPGPIKAQWATMTPEARDAVMSAHREMNNRLAETGRVAAAARPIYDTLVKAAQEMPALQNMRPDQIAADVFELAKTADALARDPVGTLLKVAEKHGAVEALRQKLGGQEATDRTPELVQEIRSLKAQLAQVADPTALEQRVMQTMTMRETERVVQEYASKADHWSAVEAVMPQYVQIAQNRLGVSASAKDVLDAAYDMAIHADPELRAKVAVPVAQPDPKRVEGQVRAKSVNVVSRDSGKPRPATQRQAYEDVWDRLTS